MLPQPKSQKTNHYYTEEDMANKIEADNLPKVI